MAELVSTYLTRVRRYVRELDTTTSFWTPSFLLQLFNENYRMRCTELVMAYEGWFTLVATRDIIANKESYGFPDGLQRLLKIEIIRSDGSRVPLKRWERHESVNPDNNNTGTGDAYYPTFRPLSNGFVLEPPPIETVTNGIRIEYTGLPASLDTNDTIHPSFPALFETLLVLDTVCAALDAEGLHELGPVPSIKTLRNNWEENWLKFIDNRVVLRQRVDPFLGPYSDY